MSARMLDALKEVTRCLEWHMQKHGSFAMDNLAVKIARQALADASVAGPDVFSVLTRAHDAIEALDGTNVENEKLVDDYRALMMLLTASQVPAVPQSKLSAFTDVWQSVMALRAAVNAGHVTPNADQRDKLVLAAEIDAYVLQVNGVAP